ncbi:hypothetical protein SAY87_020630 [Trapa incisa]|uniref:Uncharacterized protein n=1 Tax=Trapa incisa TaxID=236973 RepID=A0AAN7PMU7_9MYRT|nr:hypothetical protein SAY87_020630 [Trapa incisa]
MAALTFRMIHIQGVENITETSLAQVSYPRYVVKDFFLLFIIPSIQKKSTGFKVIKHGGADDGIFSTRKEHFAISILQQVLLSSNLLYSGNLVIPGFGLATVHSLRRLHPGGASAGDTAGGGGGAEGGSSELRCAAAGTVPTGDDQGNGSVRGVLHGAEGAAAVHVKIHERRKAEVLLQQPNRPQGGCLLRHSLAP